MGTRDVTGHQNWRRFGRAVHQIVLCILHFESHAAMMIKQWRMKGAGHVARMGIIKNVYTLSVKRALRGRGEFRPRQTRQLPRAVDLKGRLLSCQSY